MQKSILHKLACSKPPNGTNISVLNISKTLVDMVYFSLELLSVHVWGPHNWYQSQGGALWHESESVNGKLCINSLRAKKLWFCCLLLQWNCYYVRKPMKQLAVKIKNCSYQGIGAKLNPLMSCTTTMSFESLC